MTPRSEVEIMVRGCDCLSAGKEFTIGRRLACAVGVQRAHHQDAHFGRGHGDADGFQVAHFADQDHVRILAQCRMQRRRELVRCARQFRAG